MTTEEVSERGSGEMERALALPLPPSGGSSRRGSTESSGPVHPLSGDETRETTKVEEENGEDSSGESTRGQAKALSLEFKRPSPQPWELVEPPVEPMEENTLQVKAGKWVIAQDVDFRGLTQREG
jgi:hypothetical protein